ncbi:hypothetical protein ACP4OV_029490 [Aristida adscensionis]
MDLSFLMERLGRPELELDQEVSFNDWIKRIRELRNMHMGADLESTDFLGRTHLMVASMARGNHRKAEVLLRYGAYVDAYRPGRHGGTALHHAADCNAEETVKLLLSYGASHYIRNDDGYTALDLAREKGYLKVISTIEEHICIFRGWMREKYGFFRTRRIWAVVLPLEEDSTTSHDVELAIYPEDLYPELQNKQASTPFTVIKLWAYQIMAPELNKEDPFITILDERKRYFKYSKQKLDTRFYRPIEVTNRSFNAFTMHVMAYHRATNTVSEGIPNSLPVNSPLAPSEPSKSSVEDAELAMAISASLQSTIVEGVPNVLATASATNTNAWRNPPINNLNGWGQSYSAAPSVMSDSLVDTIISSSTYNGWEEWDVPGTSSSQSSSKPGETSANRGGNEAHENICKPWDLCYM